MLQFKGRGWHCTQRKSERFETAPLYPKNTGGCGTLCGDVIHVETQRQVTQVRREPCQPQ